MPKVKVRLFATLRERYEKKEIEVEYDGTFEDLARKVSEVLGKEFYFEIFSEEGNFREDRIINLNGRNLKDLLKKSPRISLKEGDTVSIFPLWQGLA